MTIAPKTHSIVLRACFLCVFLYASSQISADEELWYEVEVIVFEQLQPDADGETWSNNPGLPELDGSIELVSDIPEFLDTELQDVEQSEGPPFAGPMAFRPLQANELGLADVNDKLANSRRYSPILHVAWRQPEFQPPTARAVHVVASDVVLLADPDVGVTPTRGGERSEGLYADSDLAPVTSVRIDGTVRLKKTRFLHVELDLAYFLSEQLRGDALAMGGKAASSGALFVDQQPAYVRLTESRKVRLNELHYFDHPLFGALVRVTLYQPEGAGP